MKNHLLSIGIMTGNSLDAADVVLTAFHRNPDKIIDLEFFSLPSPEWLFHALKDLRSAISQENGDIEKISKTYHYKDTENQLSFDQLLEAYMQFVAQAVTSLINKAKDNTNIPAIYDIDSIDLIGFHGQTCAHMPPSISNNPLEAYTLQIGNGQRLADLTGITTVYDFRSDVIMNGGEGAPLAPMHNRHIAKELENSGSFPITFINGGNTSNLAHITYNDHGKITVTGWDAGPFNHLPDMLMRHEKGMQCDLDGKIGSTGQINKELLRKLFNKTAINQNEDNFFLLPPPKSSDPQWYKMIPELLDPAIPFEDRLRTVEYFSAYALYHSLGHTSGNLEMPRNFAVFGGGWKNPVTFNDFNNLVQGNFEAAPILEEHYNWFENINTRLKEKGTPTLNYSDKYGFNGQAMEARIFADMARCKVMGIPFANKETTNASRPVVCGVIKYPGCDKSNATENLLQLLSDTHQETYSTSEERWSRAAKNWQKHILATDSSVWTTPSVSNSTDNVLYFPIAHNVVSDINIKESNEELVDLCEINNPRVKSLVNFFPEYKPSFSEYSRVRAGVYERLIKVLEFLPDNIGIAYFEGFRPLYKQKEYFDNKFKEILQTTKDVELAYQETTKYVSPFIGNIPPHCTGAAIDITLFKVTDGIEGLLNMGKFGTIFGPNNQQHTFAEETNSTERENRLLLLGAASKAGFVNYGFEWWHYSYGDKAWAFVKHLDNAIYGLALTGGKDDSILMIRKEDYCISI